ncbi:MAG: hypothetical protein ABFD60_13115 [Bryobacteraceae bacterium]
MNELLSATIPLWAILAYLVFMCGVQTMPRPTKRSGAGYVWAYRFLHLLCMNLALFLDPMKKLKTADEEVR